MRAKPIFVGGTTSHAGKSWMSTAICAWLRRQGFRVAPFKAQNMSNNSYPCPGGGEIGRAQVAQAEACGLAPEPDMNPILLKPNSHTGSQIVLDGKVWGSMAGREYYDRFDFFLGRVLAAYERLASRFEYVVIEGAGSVAEMNLKSRDLVNLGLARRIDAPGLLVADIDRGGVFASIIGTFDLLEESERRLLRSFAVNRFRGDASLFADGVEILESRTARPCLGIFPMDTEIQIDEEDGVSLDDDERPAAPGARIAIVRLPHISNFTDFRLFNGIAEWVTKPVDTPFDCILLPGTKNTMGDLEWLRHAGLDEWIFAQHRRGASVVGVCGGYQMMGESIADPYGVESALGETQGLALLPVRTVMGQEKTVRAVRAVSQSGIRFDAYEIHMGATECTRAAAPFATLEDGATDGVVAGRCCGTYLHGALECAELAAELIGRPLPLAAPKQVHYDRIAEWFARNERGFAEMYL
jgi:adenosylcobyric acid synthase